MIPSKTRTVFLAVSFAVVILVFNGCRDVTSGYDQRLTDADSVLRHRPDSALQLLDSIPPASLTRQSDRAYHALLLSQARYRCYVTATSDSTINIALDYYQRHKGETEKLTRAYIYKGAVMEELGEPEEAMTYYKKAMSAVSSDDYFNQGYIRLRIGRIYRDNMVADSSDIILFKQSLKYFKMVPDSFYILGCLSDIGSSYVKFNKDSMLAYLEQASELAKQLHEDEESQSAMRYIAEMKMVSDKPADIETAKRIALQQLKEPINKLEQNHLLMIAAYTLAKQNKTDSASLFLKQLPSEGLSIPGERVFYDLCLAQMALSRGDIKQYQHYYEQANHLSDSLTTNEVQQQLRDVEAKYDNEMLKYETLRYKTFWIISSLLACLIVSVLTIFLIILKKKSARRKRQLEESHDAMERMANDTARLTSQLKENQMMSDDLKQVIHHQISVFTQLVEQHYTTFAHSPKKFSELFKKSYDVNQPDSSFWTGLRAYADSTCGGIITQTMASCPDLVETDANFLSLYCCDLPTTVIMVCMGYNEAHSVYNKKRRIAELLSLDGNLDEYILHFKPNYSGFKVSQVDNLIRD